MTTAARPTFDTARGGQSQRERDLSSLSKQYSSRDLPSHTSLKSRERGQGTSEELKERDFKRELLDRERSAARDREREKRPGITQQPDQQPQISRGSKRQRIEHQNLDADDPVDSDRDDSERDSDSDSDSDDDTAALMAELHKIKAEKAAEELEKEEERRQEEEKIRMENILTGNPLLKEKYSASAEKTDVRVKRRWDDDVVFKNCSRAAPDKEEKVFINDSIRSEFHKRFMDKYIK